MNLKDIGTLIVVGGLCFSSAAAAAGTDERPMIGARVPVESLAVALPKLRIDEPQTKRPSVLPALYVSLAGMQVWDMRSTSTALNAGAREANPAAAPFANNRGAMIGLKAATTAGTIFFAEKMWKKNRADSIVMMAAINGVTAAVAMRNMQNARTAAAR